MMKNQPFYRAVILIFLTALSRLIPHPANVTPLTSLTWYATQQLSLFTSIIISLLALFISDIGLHYLFHYPLFGTWTLFTYSGLILIWLATLLIKPVSFITTLTCIMTSGLFFWCWTNFGTWLTTSLYTKNFNGLINCYMMGLPFLRNQLLGDLSWAIIIFKGFNLLPFLKPRGIKNVIQ